MKLFNQIVSLIKKEWKIILAVVIILYLITRLKV